MTLQGLSNSSQDLGSQERVQVPGAFAYNGGRGQGSEENLGLNGQPSPKDPSAYAKAVPAVKVLLVTHEVKGSDCTDIGRPPRELQWG